VHHRLLEQRNVAFYRCPDSHTLNIDTG
jgi:hypothetical protein